MSTHMFLCWGSSNEYAQHVLCTSGENHPRIIPKYSSLTLRVPITTKADDSFHFWFYFQKKTSLDISCESSAKQTIHLKYQDLFSLKNKK